MASSGGGTGRRMIPPPRLEHFVMTEKLGQGTYATVYKAYRKGEAREVVAIKCISLKSLRKPAIENLLTEIELLKEINHSHVVKMKDFEPITKLKRHPLGKDLGSMCSQKSAQWNNEYIFLIMEYCSGGDLSRFIQSKRQLPESVAKKFLQQLALALKFLHSKNIAHMDLKPQNLLLTSKENPKLKVADFGFAQYLKDKMDSTNLRGSPLYMAPEMFCSSSYDASVDLWSVGVILYEALFGAAPFRSRSFAELEKKIRSSEQITLPRDSSVSEECKDLLLSLLQRDPKQRISFEEFFAHSFLDLEHAPSASSLTQAIDLVSAAVKFDQAMNYKEAVQMYCQALDHFVPALQYREDFYWVREVGHLAHQLNRVNFFKAIEVDEEDTVKKNAIRQKVNGYIQRAEELKQHLKFRSSCKVEREPGEILRAYAKTNTQLQDGLKLAEIAELRDESEAFASALEQYRTALAVLIPILKELPGGKVKEVLGSEVQRYMRRAEEIKAYMKSSLKATARDWEQRDMVVAAEEITTVSEDTRIAYGGVIRRTINED